jgi:tetratricopeptide (TPR) repeat protein
MILKNEAGKGGLTPVGVMSAAFLAPPTPEHLQFAYFQASLVVEFFMEKHGLDKLRAVLNDLRGGIEINRALEAHIAPMEEIETSFAAYAKTRARELGPTLNWEKPAAELFRPGAEAKLREWSNPRPNNYWLELQRIRTLREDKQWAEAKVGLNRLLERYPEPRGGESALRSLAQVQRELGETAAERVTLAKFAALDGEAPDAYLRLTELGIAERDWADVALNARRFLQINPLVSAPWRALAQAAAGTGDDATAIAANRTLLQLDPANPAEVHFELARLLHHGGDAEARRQVLLALEEAPRHRAALNLLLELGVPPAHPAELKFTP